MKTLFNAQLFLIFCTSSTKDKIKTHFHELKVGLKSPVTTHSDQVKRACHPGDAFSLMSTSDPRPCLS